MIEPYPDTKTGGMPFEKWFAKCQRLAMEKGAPWLISTDPEDHREAYEDNETPYSELLNQIECAT